MNRRGFFAGMAVILAGRAQPAHADTEETSERMQFWLNGFRTGREIESELENTEYTLKRLKERGAWPSQQFALGRAKR